MKRKRYLSLLLISAVMLVSVSASRIDRDFEFSRNLDIFHSVVRELDLFYADEIDPTRSVGVAIRAMLANLDPYTSYIPESDIEDIRLMTTGEYGGLGAMIGQMGDQVVITDPYEGTPAQKAGLRAGDVIEKIDGKSVKGKSSAEISELMKGQLGSAVTISVSRPYSGEQLTFTLQRDKIRFPNVPYYGVIGRTAYIRQTGFTEGAGLEVKRALLEMKEQGIDNLVLDLRNNPGGLLIEAVEIMNLFVARNQEIVTTKGKNKEWETTYATRHEPVDTLIPVAVLVNSSSASASEIVAGAMQDLDRGIVIGTRTFGKGLVQTTRDLSYNAKLKLTTGKYYIPSGRCIQALDYSHRRADGSVGNIADSLVSSFKTRNRRTVYDGGGIEPDVQVNPVALGKLSANLIYQQKFFDFATQYRNTTQETPEPDSFSINDSVYALFRDHVIHSDFSYGSASEQAAKDLISKAKAEKYYEQNRELLDQVLAQMTPDLSKDLDDFREEIAELLAEEILSRYHHHRGRIQYMLRHDEALEKAMALLGNPSETRRILGVQ